jgi:hypothetical protein
LPAHGPLRHDTGAGWVAQHPGQYADALSRKIKVCLVLVRISRRHLLHHQASAAQTLQTCLWGPSDRSHQLRPATVSPRSYMQHHSQRLSRAAVMLDATAICKKIITLKQQACLLPRPILSVA